MKRIKAINNNSIHELFCIHHGLIKKIKSDITCCRYFIDLYWLIAYVCWNNRQRDGDVNVRLLNYLINEYANEHPIYNGERHDKGCILPGYDNWKININMIGVVITNSQWCLFGINYNYMVSKLMMQKGVIMTYTRNNIISIKDNTVCTSIWNQVKQTVQNEYHYWLKSDSRSIFSIPCFIRKSGKGTYESQNVTWGCKMKLALFGK